MSLRQWHYSSSGNDSTWGPNEFKVLHDGSGVGSVSNQSSSISVVFMVEYAYVGNFLDDLLGYSTLQSHVLYRTIPEQHPTFENFYATRADFKPVGQPTPGSNYVSTQTGPNWSKAVVTAQYTPLPFPVLTDSELESGNELERFCTKTLMTKVEYLTTRGAMQFVSGGGTLATPPGFAVCNQIYTVKLHRIPTAGGQLAYPPTETQTDTCIGKVHYNNGGDNIDGFGDGEILLLEANSELVLPGIGTRNGGGQHFWDVTFVFGVRFTDWNKLYNVNTGTWQYVTNDGTDPAYLGGGGTGKTIYQTTDLTTLFYPVNWS